MAKEGSIIDASFVDVPKQSNTREQNSKIKEEIRHEGFEEGSAKGSQKDCIASWTKKNNEIHYDYKNHAKVDLKTKLIDSYCTTPANRHDSKVFEELLDGRDKAVFADSTYLSEENDGVLLARSLESFVMLKAHRPPLSKEDIAYNRSLSSIRVRVVHVFGRMAAMGADFCRLIGLRRAG